MTADPTWLSNLQDRMEADVAGWECCTRHVESKAITEAGERLDS